MWKIMAFIAFDVIAFVAVAAITYRWLFKRLFDWFFSLLCLIVLSPLFIGLGIRNKNAKKGRQAYQNVVNYCIIA